MFEKDVSVSLRNTHQKLIDIMRQKIFERNLTFRLFHVLILIQENKGINQKELAKMMKLTQGAMSGSIKRLLELGYIKQVPLESDNRYNTLVITKKGEVVIRDHSKDIDMRFEKIFEDFSEDDLTKFNEYLNLVNYNLDKISEEDKKEWYNEQIIIIHGKI